MASFILTKPSCTNYRLTGACPRYRECHHTHEDPDEENLKVVLFPKFYKQVNTVRAMRSSGEPLFSNGSTHPPMEVSDFFKSIYPVVRTYGLITRMAISTNNKIHLAGNFYVEYQEPTDAYGIEANLGEMNLIDCNDLCQDLFPNIHLRIVDKLGRRILKTKAGRGVSKVINFLCGPIEVNLTPMTFKHGACRDENCDETNCILLHLVTTTTEQLLQYEKSYKHYSDEDMLELEESLKKMELEESLKRKETAENLEGLEASLRWHWKYRDQLS